MLHTKKQNYYRLGVYGFSFAFLAIVSSYTLWTTAVTQWYVAHHMSVIEHPVMLSNQKDVTIHFSENTFDIKPNLRAIEDSFHFAASDPTVTAQLLEQESSVDPMDIQDEVELLSWELSPWYTLTVPRIGLNTTVYLPSKKYWNKQNWDLLESQMQEGLNRGAVAYPHSVLAGEEGNLLIAGHSSPPNEEAESSGFGHLFARIPELEQGDTITIHDGASYVDYVVTDMQVVSADHTDILHEQNKESVLKLITCYPIGTTKDRWVVTAVKKDQG